MKREIFWLGLSFLLVAALVLASCGPIEEEGEQEEEEEEEVTVTFPDTNLEANIRAVLGKPVGGEITATDLAQLTTLEANGIGITDLSSLEYCTSLTSLDLGNNQINDISPLVENSGIGAGEGLMLNRNNLDLSEGSDDMENIQILENRGVEFYY